MHAQPPVVILGAGLAGLTAATYLQRHGIPVRVFEAGPHVAGLAASSFDDEGFTYDCGAHFITNRLAASVGIAAQCRLMPRYGETVYLQRRKYAYPFGLMRNGNFVASAIKAKASGILQPRTPQNAAEWYRQSYGRELADRVAIPLTEAWSGTPADQLSPAVGDKFATSMPRTLMLKSMGYLTKRTVAIGYSGTFPESPHVWHVYPNGGMGKLCEHLAEEVRDSVQTNSPVQAIRVENERVVGVRVGGEEIETNAVINTAPVNILAKMTTGTDRLKPLSQFRYRAMVFVNLKLAGPSGLPDVVTWTPQQDLPFFRLSDIGLGLPWLAPPGKTVVTADIGCEVGDATWTAKESDLGETCINALDRIVPGVKKLYLGCRVMKTALAYPVYRLDYEAERQRFAQSTGVEGLISIGRNGEFAHILMEDVYWRTRRKLRTWIDEKVAV